MSIRKRMLLVGVVGIAILLAGVAVRVALPRQPRFDRATMERVEVGMSREEVEAMLGPPGYYRDGPVIWPPTTFGDWGRERWACDEGMLSVRFDRAGVVEDAYILDVPTFPKPSLFDRLRTRLGL